DGGKLYHSLASNFGPVTTSDSPPSTFNRFRTVSPWGDVGAAVGVFGTISSAAIVGHPTSISVFFLADAGNKLHKLWHAVRFASGSWRSPPDDVLALNGDAPNGAVDEYKVSAGNCPAPGATDWNDTTNEMLVVLSGGSSNQLGIRVIRVVSTPQSWPTG